MKIRTPLTRFIKRAIKDPKNFSFYKKEYLVEKSIGRQEKISYTPSFCTIYITFRCNFRCPTCLYLLKDKNAFEGGKDMSLESFNWLLQKFGKDLKKISLGGGEPTLHPQFSEIVRSVKKRGLWLGVSTNGTLIAKRLGDLKYFDKINVSLDGVDYQSFQKLRNGTREQYDEVIKGIHLLRDSGIPFNLSFLLFEESLQDINKILEFAREARPAVLNLHSGNPHGSDWTPLTINRPKVQNFLKEILKKEDYPFSIKLPIIFDPASELFHKQNCPLLWLSTYIGWNGDIAYCCHLGHDPKIGNIFEGYDFNSPAMVNFRKAMIAHKYPKDCLYCQRRFLETFSGYFNSKKKKWVVPEKYYEPPHHNN